MTQHTDAGGLTKTMQRAVAHMRATNGKLYRYPGGFWRARTTDAKVWAPDFPDFGTPTVEALVARGIAEYTEWKDGRNGPFPVECTLLALLPEGEGE